MKDKRIRFDDRLYLTMFSFVVSILSLLVLIFEIDDIPIWEAVICCITFTLFLAGVFVFSKMGIHIYYKRGIIKFSGIIKFEKPIIKLIEIKNISFAEIQKHRKKFYFCEQIISSAHDGLLREPDFVYRNGKVYKFTIELKDGNILVIPYFRLFKVISKRRIHKQETYIKRTIEELNQYLGNTCDII